MYTSTISALAVLLVVRLALADFKVFCGMDMNSGDGITAADCMFFNNPPDCDDVIGGSVPFYIERDNDASGGGLACDGCSSAVAVQDWDVTRLEINEPDYFDNGADHFTIYKTDAGADIHDVDNNIIGSCTRPADAQIAECSGGISFTTLKNIYDCVTAITFNDSAN